MTASPLDHRQAMEKLLGLNRRPVAKPAQRGLRVGTVRNKPHHYDVLVQMSAAAVAAQAHAGQAKATKVTSSQPVNVGNATDDARAVLSQSPRCD